MIFLKNKAKIIFHIDMNAFFASVEEIKNPFLKGRAFAVGIRGSKKGVLSTASYEARKFGIGSAMPTNEALKRCPSLIIVDHHFDLYKEYSMLFMNLLKEYTQIIEQASIDEAFLDMTEYVKDKDAINVAKEIQGRILNELGLPCSIGIGPNLYMAKMGSDYKKPLGITVMRYRDIEEVLWPLKIGDMFGVGKKSVPHFNRLGIYTIGDLANYPDKEFLRRELGDNQYNYCMDKAYGKGSDVVMANRHHENQSIGNSRTFDEASNDEEILLNNLKNVTKITTDRIEKHNYMGKTISITIRYSDFKTLTRSKTIAKYISTFDEIYPIVEELFLDNWDGGRVRLLGVTLANIVKGNKITDEYNLFDVDRIEKMQKVIDAKKSLQNRFGNKIIK